MTKPSTKPRKRPPSLLLVFASHLLLFFALGCLLYHLVPRFDDTFREWELHPPGHTALVLSVSRLLVSYWYLAILLTIPYYFLLKAINRLDEKSPGLLTFWTILIWYAGAFFLIFVAFALISMFISGTQSLSK
jgi:type II secretory pathway component PulF